MKLIGKVIPKVGDQITVFGKETDTVGNAVRIIVDGKPVALGHIVSDHKNDPRCVMRLPGYPEPVKTGEKYFDVKVEVIYE